MKLRVEVVVEDDAGREMKRVAVMEKRCDSQNALAAGLGLSMDDGKSLLGSIQRNYLELQVQCVSCDHAHCPKCTAPMKRKDIHSIVYRTLFGKFTLPNDRFFSCVSWGPLVFSAISDGTQTQHWRGGGVGRSLI
ncbi:MAG: hypothetical protein K9J77_11070 [Rhodoferax sp.]|nr:hypothetical protein [Rhodoferax sp.]